MQVSETAFRYFAEHKQRLLVPGELLQTARPLSLAWPSASSVLLRERGGCFALVRRPHLSTVPRDDPNPSGNGDAC